MVFGAQPQFKAKCDGVCATHHRHIFNTYSTHFRHMLDTFIFGDIFTLKLHRIIQRDFDTFSGHRHGTPSPGNQQEPSRDMARPPHQPLGPLEPCWPILGPSRAWLAHPGPGWPILGVGPTWARLPWAGQALATRGLPKHIATPRPLYIDGAYCVDGSS